MTPYIIHIICIVLSHPGDPSKPDSEVKELRNGRLAMLAFSGAGFALWHHGWENPYSMGISVGMTSTDVGEFGIFHHVSLPKAQHRATNKCEQSK